VLQGDKIAVQGKDFLDTEMVAEAISKAQNLTRECVKKKYKCC
jgi:hypothetical protein